MCQKVLLSLAILFSCFCMSFLQAAPPSAYAEVYTPYTETQADGSMLTVSTFTPSGIIDGNVKLEAGVLDLDGKRLQINGHLIHSGGDLDIGNGTLIITGDYRIQTPSGSVYTYSDGRLIMQNMIASQGKIKVHGDFVMDSRHRSSSLSNGTLEIKGDFTQLSSHDSADAIRNFENRGLKVLLSGDGEQNVNFNDVWHTYTQFKNLEISNPSGLVNLGDMAVSNLRFSENILQPTLRGIHINSYDFTLQQDLTIEVPEGSLAKIGGSGTKLDLNGYLLTIKGDLMHSTGQILVNGGALKVTGDYRIQTPSDTSYRYPIGILKMVNADDKVLVLGSFKMDTGAKHKSLFSAGTLEVKGDFMQLPSFLGVEDNFQASGTFKVILSGEDHQVVTLANTSGDVNGMFSFLEIANTAGIDFSSSLAVSQLFDHCGYPFTITNEVASYFPDFDRDGLKDHVDAYPKDANNQSNTCSKPDRDGDGIADDIDAFPDDWNESVDTDNDGIGNRVDKDDDGDGVNDQEELQDGTDPLDISSYHINTAPVVFLGEDITAPLGETTQISSAGYDSDSNTVVAPPGSVWKSWILDNYIIGRGDYLYFTPTSVGDHIITLTLEDDDGATTSDLIVVTVPDGTSNDLTSGLVAHYEFEGDLRDSSGNENNGTSENEIDFASTVLGKAALFSPGNEKKIEVEDSNSLNTHDEFTLSLWVNPSRYIAAESDSVLIQKYYSAEDWAGGEYTLNISEDGTINFKVANYDEATISDTIKSNPIPFDEWSHVVASFDSGEMRLYINGQLVERKLSTVEQVTTKEYAYNGLRIGNVVDMTKKGGRFIGSLDDIRVYNRMLKVPEAKGIFEEGTDVLTRKLISGMVQNDDGEGLAGINVKLEYLADGEEKSVTVVTDDLGNYGLAIDKIHFDDTPEAIYLIYAYHEGYRPSTRALKIDSEDLYQINFTINPIQPNEVILEIEPQLHHLGDDNYSGSVNSQFQKNTEGIDFSRFFEISSSLYSSFENATLTFEAKGIQIGGNLRINDVYYSLPSSPSGGGYETYTITLAKDAYHSGNNELSMFSEANVFGDNDDFEFSNIVLTFNERDTDKDGYLDRLDTDDDNDGMSDVWELANGLDPQNANDARSDADGDNVVNIDEYRASTDPQLADTDGDGINDNLDQVVGSGLWGYACNVVNDPSSSTRRWGINQYNLAHLPNAVADPVFSVGLNRKIQSVACDPSGKNILFSLKDSLRGDYEIYELDISSGYLKQITDNDTDDVDVTRSRDGRTIAWQKRLPDNRQAIELLRMEESGEYTSKTMASASPFVQPALSPNGNWLTFVQLRANFFAVMRYDIANNKYKEVKSIARRKKLYHPSITDDGNKVGWSERVSQRRYRVKDIAEGTTVDILNDASGIEHAVLSGDGEHVIYNVNASNIRETYLTSLTTLDTQVIGETQSDPVRYLSANWSGVTVSEGFIQSQFAGKQLTSYKQSLMFSLAADGSGHRYTIGSDDVVAMTWELSNGFLVMTEAGGESWSAQLLATSGNQYTVSMVVPDEQGGVSRLVDTLYAE